MAQNITGNATVRQKETLLLWSSMLGLQGRGFADAITDRIRFVEASIMPHEHGPTRVQARVVNEITVGEDMAHGLRMMHGGCASFLIDVCSTYPLMLLDTALDRPGTPSVSQSLSMTFHAPAPIGSKLRIISTSMSQGARISTSRAEIWDIEKGRLVVSGVHVKMSPTVKDPEPTPSAKL